MDNKLIIISILLLSSILQIKVKATSFYITNFGAKSGGKYDNSKALEATWKQACMSMGPSTIVIPKGLFYVTQAKFQGPCKAAPITFQIQGTLQAHIDPKSISKGEWVTFQHIDRLIITGGGTFDGRGNKAWLQNDCHKSSSCKNLPYNLSFNFITNSLIGPITTLDSKNFHTNVLGCRNVTFTGYTVKAPAKSINTDGIHIGRSKEIYIVDSNMQTGDDCISIGDDSHQIYVTRVTCGPGHGISLGSLGKYKNEGPVSGIYIENCTLINTDNGIRLKTWPNSFQGDVTDMHVKDIHVQNVRNPIIVDQNYCPWNKCSLKSPSKVKLSKLSFTNIWGTSTSPVIVKLDCSKSFPCQNVELSNIDIKYVGKTVANVISTCENVKPIIKGKQNPKICANESS